MVTILPHDWAAGYDLVMVTLTKGEKDKSQKVGTKGPCGKCKKEGVKSNVTSSLLRSAASSPVMTFTRLAP